MFDTRRRLLLSEIELQCGFALKAYGEAAAALERRDAADFWRAVQALLGAAAHLHRFLAPDAELRSALRVPETSSLLRAELDSADDLGAAFRRWTASHKRGPLRSSNFGPHGASDADPAVFARYIDVSNSRLILYGVTYELSELLAAIADLSAAVKAELRSLQQVV